MTEIEKVTNNQAKARSIYNSLIKGNIFYTGISKNLAIALIELGIDSSTTDKLSVEKLQEHLLPYKKETVQKIIDEKMQLVTADEFLKLHKESLTAIRENDKLQEQLNTTKKALTEIIFFSQGCYDSEYFASIARKALAAIGGYDE